MLFELLQRTAPALAREVAKDPKQMQAIREMEADHIAIIAGAVLEEMIPGVVLEQVWEKVDGSTS